MNKIEQIQDTIFKMRETFTRLAAEMDEAAAIVSMYRDILTVSHIFSLLDIAHALNGNKDLLNWFIGVYKRCDRALYDDYEKSR